MRFALPCLLAAPRDAPRRISPCQRRAAATVAPMGPRRQQRARSTRADRETQAMSQRHRRGGGVFYRRGPLTRPQIRKLIQKHTLPMATGNIPMFFKLKGDMKTTEKFAQVRYEARARGEGVSFGALFGRRDTRAGEWTAVPRSWVNCGATGGESESETDARELCRADLSRAATMWCESPCTPMCANVHRVSMHICLAATDGTPRRAAPELVRGEHDAYERREQDHREGQELVQAGRDRRVRCGGGARVVPGN